MPLSPALSGPSFDAQFPTGGLPANRLVTINGTTNKLALCGASDDTPIGATGYFDDTSVVNADQRLLYIRGTGCVVIYSAAVNTPPIGFRDHEYQGSLFLLVEAADGSSIVRGAPVYQAADGKISDTGTKRVGIALANVLSSPELWSVLFD